MDNKNRAVREYLKLPTHKQIKIWRELGYSGSSVDGDKPFFEWVKANEKVDSFIQLVLIPFIPLKEN